MHEKEQGESKWSMGDHWSCGICSKEFEKEFKIAMLNKKEKILEAKLEFVREMKDLIKKSREESR